MLGLLYFGRLEKEKWFDSIIKVIKSWAEADFFIFWKGSLENDILALSDLPNVHFFGFQPLEKIKSYLPNIDYCLMPSEFLETFWLSALNALSRGIPVIGYKKWGLEPFILPECNLFSYKWSTTAERLENWLKLAQKSDKNKVLEIAQNYTKTIWYEKFCNLLYKNSSSWKRSGSEWKLRIVLVSDFINKVWWIETYLHDVKDILETHGHKVILRWGKLPKWTLGKIRIWMGLILAPFNFWDALKFKNFIKKEKPDLIWYNSLLRNLGHRLLRPKSIRNSQWQKTWMMYHDFGYFYPFPKDLHSVQQVQTPFNFQNFLSGAKDKWLIQKIATIFKYFWLKPLKKELKKQIDLHLVPSEFMVHIVQDSYQLEKWKVKSFKHFIQE